MDCHLWLVGMMGSGKSRIGRDLARALGAPFVDTDETVAARVGCTIAQFWGERGEHAFRDMEAATVAQIASAAPAVVATGGGAVLRPSNVATMRGSGLIVWLTAPVPVLAERLGSGAGRPLLAEDGAPDRLTELLAERREVYAAAAEVSFATDESSPQEVVERIESWWRQSM